MLAANRAAAVHLTLRGAGLLFRHQQGLDAVHWAATRVAGCARTALPSPKCPRCLACGPCWPRPRARCAPNWSRIRQAMTPAVYDERQGSHFSLGFHAYTHFTSPIRHYVLAAA